MAGTNTAQKMRKGVVLRRMETLLLRGITNHAELGSAFNLSENTAKLYTREIYWRWSGHEPDELKEKRLLRQRQLEYLLTLSLNDYDLSKRGKRRTRNEPRECEFCTGKGKTEEMPKKWVDCHMCGGSGVIEEVTEYFEIGEGNPNHLRMAKDVIVELGRLQGLYPQTTSVSAKSLLMSAKDGQGGEKQVMLEELFVEAPADTIIRAKAVLEELKESKAAKVKKLEHK